MLFFCSCYNLAVREARARETTTCTCTRVVCRVRSSPSAPPLPLLPVVGWGLRLSTRTPSAKRPGFIVAYTRSKSYRFSPTKSAGSFRRSSVPAFCVHVSFISGPLSACSRGRVLSLFVVSCPTGFVTCNVRKRIFTN